MRLSDRRFLRGTLLILLPALASTALFAIFLCRYVPVMKKDAAGRVEAMTESAVRRLRSDGDSADMVWERGKGVVKGGEEWREEFPPDMTWKDWRPAGGGRTKEMFGWRDTETGRFVWVRGGEGSRFVYGEMTDIDVRDDTSTIVAAVSVIFAAALFLAAAGVWSFRENIKTRDDFLAAAAHDLSTPLSSMRLLIGKDDAYASVLADRLSRIIDNIKDFVRYGGARRRPSPSDFDFAAAYREAYGMFAEEYRDMFDGGDVPFSNLHSGPVIVRADETLAVQTIWNILGNDLKYAAPYGRVSVELSVEGGFAQMRFADEGPGMSKREMKKAFDRYYRAKTALGSGKGGFGIGLATAKEFAAAMGGDIILSRNSPRGLVYVFRLPLAPRTTTPATASAAMNCARKECRNENGVDAQAG